MYETTVGQSTDVEATGDGSLIAVSKRQRTLLDQIRVLVAGTLIVAGAGGGALAVSGPLTDAQLRASAIDVACTSGCAGGNPNGQATMANSAPVVIASNQSSVGVSVSNIPNVTLDDWLGSTAPTVGSKTSANSIPVVVASDQGAVPVTLAAAAQVSIGSSSGKANVLRTGTLVTTAVTADQVVHTYTVTSGKTFYLEYLSLQGRLTVISATASIMGAMSMETPSGTKAITHTFTNPTVSLIEPDIYTFGEPIPIAAGVVIRCVVTPAATTSMTWICNFGGYEK